MCLNSLFNLEVLRVALVRVYSMELPVFASIVLYPHCIEDNNVFGVGEGKGIYEVYNICRDLLKREGRYDTNTNRTHDVYIYHRHEPRITKEMQTCKL